MSANREALNRALAGWNAGDLERYLDLYDERIKLHGYTPEPMNKAEATGFYSSIFAAFPAARLDFHDVLETGDRVAVRFTMTGRHEGDFLGVPPTHRKIALPGITILRFEDDSGLAIERWSTADMLGLLVQLGAVPAPG
jgi:predicted ester cyclase